MENCPVVGKTGLWSDHGCHEWFLHTVCKAKQVRPELKSWRLLVSCLTGFARQEFPVHGLLECAARCARDHPACRSFNLLRSPVNGTAAGADGNAKTCQLNNVTRSEVDRAHFVKTDTMCIYGEK